MRGAFCSTRIDCDLKGVTGKVLGPTAFAPLDADASYFGSAKNTWMVSFRVRDLDAVLAQLRGRRYGRGVGRPAIPQRQIRSTV